MVDSSQCPYEAEVCEFSTPNQDNWLITPVRSIPEHEGQRLSSVYILVNYTTFNCTDPSCDLAALGLYVLHSSVSNPDVMDFSTYQEVETTLSNNVAVEIPLTKDFYAISIRDTGTCVRLHRLQLYYSTCLVPFAIVNGIGFGANNTVECVANTVMSMVDTTCSSTGMLSPPSPCECAMGFSGADGTSCTGECVEILERSVGERGVFEVYREFGGVCREFRV